MTVTPARDTRLTSSTARRSRGSAVSAHDERLRRLARRQHGVFLLRQAVALGYSRSSIRRRVDRGQWEEMLPRVSRSSIARPVDWRQVAMGLTLVTNGVGSRRDRRSALRLGRAAARAGGDGRPALSTDASRGGPHLGRLAGGRSDDRRRHPGHGARSDRHRPWWCDAGAHLRRRSRRRDRAGTGQRETPRGAGCELWTPRRRGCAVVLELLAVRRPELAVCREPLGGSSPPRCPRPRTAAAAGEPPRPRGRQTPLPRPRLARREGRGGIRRLRAPLDASRVR